MSARSGSLAARSLALVAACAAAQALGQQPRDVPTVTAPIELVPQAMESPTGATNCAQCHTTSDWAQAVFAHDKTGFPLRGAHAGAACRTCHAGDFAAPVARACAGCHQDVHRGEFGQQCQGCHQEGSWMPLFNVAAHRRTSFPLVGRHAFIPCTECHIAMTNRNFDVTTVKCLGCHQKDYNATAATQVNHAQLQFGTACGACHTSIAWQGAHFQAHDACFQIIGGAHSGIACLTCHTSLAGAQVTGACATHTAACSSCHAHVCAKMDTVHTKVPGYQCKDPKCYACHRIVSSP